MSADAASAVLFLFAIHCGFVYALVRLCLKQEAPPSSMEVGPRPSTEAFRARIEKERPDA